MRAHTPLPFGRLFPARPRQARQEEAGGCPEGAGARQPRHRQLRCAPALHLAAAWAHSGRLLRLLGLQRGAGEGRMQREGRRAPLCSNTLPPVAPPALRYRTPTPSPACLHSCPNPLPSAGHELLDFVGLGMSGTQDNAQLYSQASTPPRTRPAAAQPAGLARGRAGAAFRSCTPYCCRRRCKRWTGCATRAPPPATPTATTSPWCCR